MAGPSNAVPSSMSIIVVRLSPVRVRHRCRRDTRPQYPATGIYRPCGIYDQVSQRYSRGLARAVQCAILSAVATRHCLCGRDCAQLQSTAGKKQCLHGRYPSAAAYLGACSIGFNADGMFAAGAAGNTSKLSPSHGPWPEDRTPGWVEVYTVPAAHRTCNRLRC